MRGRGSRESTPPITPGFRRYETKFYEWQALSYVATVLSVPVLTNVRQSLPHIEQLQSQEVDGVTEINGRRVLIEVKSYSLSQSDVDWIIAKYRKLERDELLLIAPAFHPNLVVPSNVKAIPFIPDLLRLHHAYNSKPYILPAALQDELAEGKHHFRFVSAARKKGETARFRNQIDKRIGTVNDLMREVQRQDHLADLPVRVFWSVSRWLFPKELFFSTYQNHLLRRGLVFDIDGKSIHNGVSPCELLPGHTVCARCVAAAKASAIRLIDFLERLGFNDPMVLFSGRQGFHVYLLRHNLTEPDIHYLVQTIGQAGIAIDAPLTLDPKAVVTFPGSIHGLTMLPAFPVDNLAAFELTDVNEWRSSAWPNGPAFEA